MLCVVKARLDIENEFTPRLPLLSFDKSTAELQKTVKGTSTFLKRKAWNSSEMKISDFNMFSFNRLARGDSARPPCDTGAFLLVESCEEESGSRHENYASCSPLPSPLLHSLPVLPCPPSSPPSALPHPSRSPCSASSADRKLQLYLAFCKLGGGWNSFGKVFTSAALYFGRLAKTSQASSSALDRFWKVPVPHPSLPQQTVVIPQFYLPDIWAVGESPSFTLCLCARACVCECVLCV